MASIDFVVSADGQPIALIAVGDKTLDINAADTDVSDLIEKQLTEERTFVDAYQEDGNLIDEESTGRPVDNPGMLQIALLDLPMQLSDMYRHYTLRIDGDWDKLAELETV